MGIMNPSILTAQVMHNRVMPKKNRFCYGVYYLALPLDAIENGSIASQVSLNRFGVHSFYTCDHGPKDGSSLRRWAEDTLATHHLPKPQTITLICMPRVLGYVFNPVSFWLCYNKEHEIYAIICEVNNTFGETNSYVCAHPQGNAITNNDWLKAEKCLYVSPFLKIEGQYHFRFQISEQHCRIQIHYNDQDQNTVLITAVHGRFHPLSRPALLKAFIKNPLMTFRVIMLIHYQALKLLIKRVRYSTRPKPEK